MTRARADKAASRGRPSEELLSRQRAAKARWRSMVARQPFREKVAIVLDMQKRLYPILRGRRSMRWWERPWDIEP